MRSKAQTSSSHSALLSLFITSLLQGSCCSSKHLVCMRVRRRGKGVYPSSFVFIRKAKHCSEGLKQWVHHDSLLVVGQALPCPPLQQNLSSISKKGKAKGKWDECLSKIQWCVPQSTHETSQLLHMWQLSSKSRILDPNMPSQRLVTWKLQNTLFNSLSWIHPINSDKEGIG